MNKENEFNIDDMALDEESQEKEEFDMGLESRSPFEIEAKIKEMFPDQDVIKVEEGLEIMKMASGDYTVNNKLLKDLRAEDLNKIDDFLSKKR